MINCCETGSKNIEFKTADNFFGPEVDGFCIALHGWDVCYMRINYCPWCGTQVEAALAIDNQDARESDGGK